MNSSLDVKHQMQATAQVRKFLQWFSNKEYVYGDYR